MTSSGTRAWCQGSSAPSPRWRAKLGMTPEEVIGTFRGRGKELGDFVAHLGRRRFAEAGHGGRQSRRTRASTAGIGPCHGFPADAMSLVDGSGLRRKLGPRLGPARGSSTGGSSQIVPSAGHSAKVLNGRKALRETNMANLVILRATNWIIESGALADSIGVA